MASADRGRPAVASGGRRDLYAGARRGVQVFVYGSVADLRAAESSRAIVLETSRARSNLREHSRTRDTHDTFATPTGNIRNHAEKFFTGRSLVVHEIRDFPRCLVISL
jgi:hypothetical protein